MESSSGFTLIELMATLTLSAVLLTVPVLSFIEMQASSGSSAAEIVAFIKTARAKALASTSAVTLRPISSTQIVAISSPSCGSGPFLVDQEMSAELSGSAGLTDISWEVCFNARGFPDASETISLEDADNNMQSVEVLLGGGVRSHAG